MGKGRCAESPIVEPRLRRFASPARGGPPRVWHYTSTIDARAIVRDCVMYPGTRGTDGPGVYFTHLEPTPDRLRISLGLWNRWTPQKMEAYVGLPFIADEMEQSKHFPHIYVVKKSELSITGLEGLEVGFWDGADPSDPQDVGSWRSELVTACR